MTWGYVGGGCWELQNGLLLGCINGSKFDDKNRITLERMVDGKWAVELELPMEERTLSEAKALVVRHMQERLERELMLLRHVSTY